MLLPCGGAPGLGGAPLLSKAPRPCGRPLTARDAPPRKRSQRIPNQRGGTRRCPPPVSSGAPTRSGVARCTVNARQGIDWCRKGVPMERQRISSGSPYEPQIGFSRALRVGNRVLVSGTAPVWPDGACDPDPAAQARRCLEIIVAALREAGAGPEHVVRTRTYITSA